MRRIRVASVQMESAAGDKGANLATIERFLRSAAAQGVDDNEIRTGNAMILDPYGRVLVETCKADDDMVVADLDPALRENCTGLRWIKTRRPELYQPLTIPTGLERDTRSVRLGQ